MVTSNNTLLIQSLANIPPTWELTPIKEKSPLRPDWQTEAPISREELANLLRDGQQLWSHKKQKYWYCHYTGYGLRTGSISGGLLAIDQDGATAGELLARLSEGDLPTTVAWTSGKSGKRQLVYQLPPAIQEQLHDFNRAVLTELGEFKTTLGEILEFRYNRCQSALPPSLHPETGFYRWINSPQNIAVAEAPQWLCDRLLDLAEQERVKAEAQAARQAIPSNADAWDIRSFANRLDGYNENGRRKGWATCKCPAHNGTSDNSLHIEQSTGAFKCHAQCNPKDVYKAALELAIARGYELPEGKRKQGQDRGTWLHQIRKQIQKAVKTCWQAFNPEIKQIELEPETPPSQPDFEYDTEQGRRETLAEVSQQYKHILIQDGMGFGKTTLFGQLTPPFFQNVGGSLFPAEQLLYSHWDHSNPSTQSLADWKDLVGRHNGRELVTGPGGSQKIRRAKPDSGNPIAEAANCIRTNLFSTLQALNYSGIEQSSSSPICQTCPRHPKNGGSCDYLDERKATLLSQRFRAHSQSLPNPEDYDYSRTVIGHDEVGSDYPHRNIQVGLEDVTTAIADLATRLEPEQWRLICPIVSALKDWLDGTVKLNKHGLGLAELREKLGDIPSDLDLDTINGTLCPPLPNLDPILFDKGDEVLILQIKQKARKQWLLQLLEVLQGRIGYVHLAQKKLVITLPDSRLSKIVKAAGLNIYLDGTATREDIALRFGIHPQEIAVLRWKATPATNVKRIQIATVGRLGASRGEDQERRAKALVEHYQSQDPENTAILDFKAFAKKDWAKWFIDSRGSNDLAKKQRLIVVGTPCPNMNALAAEFTIFYGRTPKPGVELVRRGVKLTNKLPDNFLPYFESQESIDPEFREFVRWKTLNEFHQADARLRANLRPDKQLEVIFICDYALDFEVELVKASEVVPEAGTRQERFIAAVKAAIAQLRAEGRKITQTAIAALTNYSQQYISQQKKLLLLLLDPPNSESSKNSKPLDPPLPAVVSYAHAAQTLAAELPENEVLPAISDLFFNLMPEDLLLPVWELLSAEVQSRIFKAIALALPLRELEAIVSV